MKLKQSFALEFTDERVAWLKGRFGVKTNDEVKNKLQRIADDLIDRQFVSSVDDEFQTELKARIAKLGIKSPHIKEE